MKYIDVRFNQEEIKLIKNMVGKTLTKYKCDPFEFSTAVYGIVGICTNYISYAFTNMVQVMDYYGAEEDVAIMHVEERNDSKIKSLISENTMIEIPVNKTIKEIYVINEHQKVFLFDKQIYDVRLTRGIIFYLDDNSEVSLEKNVWFSEMITIDKGHHLLNKFTPIEEFIENWTGNYRGECFREIIKFF